MCNFFPMSGIKRCNKNFLIPRSWEKGGVMKKAYTIRANIHTIEIVTDKRINASQQLKRIEESGTAIDREIAKKIRACIRGGTGLERRKFILNMNKWSGDNKNTWNYAEFMENLATLTKYLEIENAYTITRVDMKFDSSDPKFYEENKKLVRFWMTAIADGTEQANMWLSLDGRTLEQRSFKLWADDRSFELEYYDKDLESFGKDPSKARIEFHIMGKFAPEQLQEAINTRIDDLWLNHTGVALDDDCYDLSLKPTQERQNAALINLWKSGNYKNLHRFIEQDRVREVLFTRGQLVLLLSQLARDTELNISIVNPQKWIDKHNNRYGKIEFVKESDIDELWKCLEDAKQCYFDEFWR